MEIEEQKWELTGEEETSLVLRKSRNGEIDQTAEIAEAKKAVSDTNGHGIEGANGAQSEESVTEKEEKIIQELDGVLELAANGGKREGETQGKEKKSGDLDGVFELKKSETRNGLLSLENLVYCDKVEGFESAHAFLGVKHILKDTERDEFNISCLGSIVENNSASALKNVYNGDLKNGTFSGSIQASQISVLEQSTGHKSYEEIESAELDQIDEDDKEVTELDVERTIRNQTTHDLYCPNCNSCITERVILRKRKRKIQIPDEDVRKKKEVALDKVLGTNSVQSPRDEVDDNDAQLLPEAEDESDKGPDVFRCLSCFSFFIPPGNGFKLFGGFGDKNGVNNVPDDQPPSMSRNWFAKMFGSNKQEPAAEQGTVAVMGNNSSLEGRDDILHAASQKPSSGKLLIAPRDELDMKATGAGDPMIKSGKIVGDNGDGNLSVTTVIKYTQDTVVESEEGTSSFSQNGGLKLQISPNEEFPAHKLQEEGQTLQSGGAVSQHIISKTEVKIPFGKPPVADSISCAPVAPGKDTVINIEEHPTGSSDIVEDTTPPADTTSATQPVSQVDIAGRDKTEEGKEFQIEIVKSIVYGGLAESITSLSVVSSAAGGGAATLNILALGMANLIGGLFVICHNLWELRGECVEQIDNRVVDVAVEQRDRYKELLGRRQNFVLHAILAIISYLVFGLVPPVVYGFSFRETDDKQLKLEVVAAASLVCIVMLAIGKAYVQRPPKPYLKLVITFVLMGVMVSGVSYAAGELVERLLEKLGVFQSGSEPMQMVRGSGRGKAWASY